MEEENPFNDLICKTITNCETGTADKLELDPNLMMQHEFRILGVDFHSQIGNAIARVEVFINTKAAPLKTVSLNNITTESANNKRENSHKLEQAFYLLENALAIYTMRELPRMFCLKESNPVLFNNIIGYFPQNGSEILNDFVSTGKWLSMIDKEYHIQLIDRFSKLVTLKQILTGPEDSVCPFVKLEYNGENNLKDFKELCRIDREAAVAFSNNL